MPGKTYLIACGVLKPDISAVLAENDIDLDAHYLEGGLHENPPELRRRLQAAIDAADEQGYEFIILGYGICGRGTIGLRTGRTPLLIPKVHDCIALFLGSDRAYRQEFRKFPGTYYISAGWYREKVQPKGMRSAPSLRGVEARERRELAEKYGSENADAIVEFLTSWTRNYQRAAFIDTGVPGKESYASYAKAMAEEFGWQYERIPGTHALLEKLFDLQRHHDEILVVPPGHTTVFDPKRHSIGVGWSGGKGSAGNHGDAIAANGAAVDYGPAADPEAAYNAVPPKPAAVATPPDVQEDTVNGAAATDERRYGLGIDAGGTYTDAVVFDFVNRTVLSSGKALTTKWDYAAGIMNAVEQLDSTFFPHIDLTAVSTTLATNAIVEGKGQQVGLLLMPGAFRDTTVGAKVPTALLQGRLDISGEELEPVDREEVLGAVRRMLKQGVRAFAVSGYAASVNPAHERQVKEIIEQESGVPSCLGSDLSELLNFHLRANTAVLNARILPLLASFLDDVERSLGNRSIHGRVMVVRGDGTLMTDAFARAHPVETTMSGPAASVAGARYLTELKSSLVVDVGGTTSDIGRIEEGAVAVREEGAQVGQWRTHVRAVDMHTEGIGGDSEIAVEKRQLSVGPRRLEPISLLGAGQELGPALDYVASHLDDFASSTRAMNIVALTDRSPSTELSETERRVYERLRERPHSLKELAEVLGVGHWSLLKVHRLLEGHCAQEAGLTPTDLLHAQDELALWNAHAAERLTRLYSAILGLSAEELSQAVFDRITRTLVIAILERQLQVRIDGNELAEALVERILTGNSSELQFSVRLPQSLVGLGAAAPYLLRRTARVFDTELTTPPNGAVANAIGAITSLVTVKRTVHIATADDGTYVVQGVPDAPRFETLEEAHEHALAAVQAETRARAREAGTDEERVHIDITDETSTAADGETVFIERRIEAWISGVPSIRETSYSRT